MYYKTENHHAGRTCRNCPFFCETRHQLLNAPRSEDAPKYDLVISACHLKAKRLAVDEAAECEAFPLSNRPHVPLTEPMIYTGINAGGWK